MNDKKDDAPIEQSLTLEDIAKIQNGEDSTPDENSVEEKKSVLNYIPWLKIAKTKDENTLVDIHVNNPMKKIIDLLEDIKKQKAFSFTLKGSLGVMGVLLALSVFGIFGGDKILCDKGLQTRTGTLKILQLTEEATDPNVSWTKAMLQKLFMLTPTTLRHRTVLLSANEQPIHLNTLLIHKLEVLEGMTVVATGKYNSCSSTLTLSSELGIEAL